MVVVVLVVDLDLDEPGTCSHVDFHRRSSTDRTASAIAVPSAWV